MIDKLAHFPGLVDQPRLDTPEGDQMERELNFAMQPCEDVECCYRVVLRFMVGRGYWPLGTRMIGPKTIFPGERQ